MLISKTTTQKYQQIQNAFSMNKSTRFTSFFYGNFFLNPGFKIWIFLKNCLHLSICPIQICKAVLLLVRVTRAVQWIKIIFSQKHIPYLAFKFRFSKYPPPPYSMHCINLFRYFKYMMKISLIRSFKIVSFRDVYSHYSRWAKSQN